MPSRRFPNRALAFRRLIVTTSKDRQRKVVDRCWGSGASSEDDPRWPRLPSWLAPECEFSYTGYAVRIPRVGRVLVVGWITSRRPLSAPDVVSGSRVSA